MGWLESHTLQDEGSRDLSLPRVVCEYGDVFLDELPGTGMWTLSLSYTLVRRPFL